MVNELRGQRRVGFVVVPWVDVTIVIVGYGFERGLVGAARGVEVHMVG